MSRREPKHHQKVDEVIIESRRADAARLLKAGHTYREIAARLDVSIGTVTTDIKATLQDWKRQAIKETDDRLQLQLRRLDDLLTGCWEEAMAGNEDKAAIALKIMDMQNRLLGLNAPEKIDHTTKGEKLPSAPPTVLAAEQVVIGVELLQAIMQQADGADDDPGE